MHVGGAIREVKSMQVLILHGNSHHTKDKNNQEDRITMPAEPRQPRSSASPLGSMDRAAMVVEAAGPREWTSTSESHSGYCPCQCSTVKKEEIKTSLAAQQLRIHQPMRGKQVQPCSKKTHIMGQLNPCAPATEACRPRAHALRQEMPL